MKKENTQTHSERLAAFLEMKMQQIAQVNKILEDSKKNTLARILARQEAKENLERVLEEQKKRKQSE